MEPPFAGRSQGVFGAPFRRLQVAGLLVAGTPGRGGGPPKEAKTGFRATSGSCCKVAGACGRNSGGGDEGCRRSPQNRHTMLTMLSRGGVLHGMGALCAQNRHTILTMLSRGRGWYGKLLPGPQNPLPYLPCFPWCSGEGLGMVWGPFAPKTGTPYLPCYPGGGVGMVMGGLRGKSLPYQTPPQNTMVSMVSMVRGSPPPRIKLRVLQGGGISKCRLVQAMGSEL